MTSSRSVIHRPSLILVITFVSVSICYYLFSSFPRPPTFQRPLNPRPRPPIYAQNGTKLEERPPKFDWHARQQHNPIPANLLIPLPHHRGTPSIPKIQYKFPVANVHHKPTAYELGKKQQVEERQDAARRAFARMWNGYRNTAWGRDVLYPISGRGTQILNNQTSWAVTLVESLDTLWIMGFKDEFAEAVTEVVANLDFSQSSEGQEFIEVWDVSVRVLGGLLAAYDVAGGKNGQFADVLLEKAVEMGDLLMGAFDTSNRMVIGRWDWRKAMAGEKQEPYENMILSELSAMTLEFTHLTQVTGDPKFYDAVQRIENMLAKHQEKSKLPGMWPIVADAVGEGRFDYEKGFGLGGMAHPTYDVLPKQFIQLAGHSTQPRRMYEQAIDVAKRHTMFKPMTPRNHDILFTAPTQVLSPEQSTLDPQVQQLSCYVGGMMAVGSKIFNRPDDLDVARKLVDGCIWASQNSQQGLMAESFYVVPCHGNVTECTWDKQVYIDAIIGRDPKLGLNRTAAEETIQSKRLPSGVVEVSDPRYFLRPSVFESIFILYRITGDSALRDAAWNIFETVDRRTRTQHGNAALNDVTNPVLEMHDWMESHWPAATLKYVYLLFSDPSVVSLDEYVFSTGGHPFRRLS